MKKKIALIGNMNNNFFALVRYLRDAGFDAHLFFHPSLDHFHPKADSFSLDYAKFCHEINWLGEGFTNLKLDACRSDLKGYCFFIGMGDEAAFAAAAGFRFDIYFPYGSDFYKYAWLPQRFTFLQRIYMKFLKKNSFEQSGRGTMAKYIKLAIVNAHFVFLDYTNEEYEKKLTDLNLKGELKRFPTPFIYVNEYQKQNNWDTHWKSIIDNIRKENVFLVLYHGRQEWRKRELNFITKNTHHLVEAFAMFVKNNPKVNTKLIMFEYGNDVDLSKELIFKLNLNNYVMWMPKMYRKDLMYLIKNVDLCSGEFGRSYLTFGTIIEAMILGKPVLNYRDDKLYIANYEYLYPCYNVREPFEISLALEDAYKIPEERNEKGLKALMWVEKCFLKNSLNEIFKIINEKN